MKKFVLVGLAAAAASAALGVAAWAQSSLPLPPGSWRDSCGDARAYYQNGARILSARCTKRGGGTEYSTLRYDQCRGDIANSNGRLVCGNLCGLPVMAMEGRMSTPSRRDSVISPSKPGNNGAAVISAYATVGKPFPASLCGGL